MKIRAFHFLLFLFVGGILFSCQRYSCECDVETSKSFMKADTYFDVSASSYGKAERECTKIGVNKGMNCFISIEY